VRTAPILFFFVFSSSFLFFRNDYYGGASASLNLEQLYEKYREGKTPPASLGKAREYSVDVVPKFIMASGTLVKLLLHTDVTKYLDFKVVDGSYVFKEYFTGAYISKVRQVFLFLVFCCQSETKTGALH
jgi:RAB protein geranylgeranyltransferase component A